MMTISREINGTLHVFLLPFLIIIAVVKTQTNEIKRTSIYVCLSNSEVLYLLSLLWCLQADYLYLVAHTRRYILYVLVTNFWSFEPDNLYEYLDSKLLYSLLCAQERESELSKLSLQTSAVHFTFAEIQDNSFH